LRARYYNPAVGRFISEDPAFDGLNWYVYCGNDPVNMVDPSGHYAIKFFNCYAYAFGISNRWMIPGKPDGRGDLLPNRYTVTQVRNWVIKDIGKKKARKVTSKKSKLKKGEYLIATKVCDDWTPLPIWDYRICKYKTQDFHFWKKDPKTKDWWDKPGQGNIRWQGKKSPDPRWPMKEVTYREKMKNGSGFGFTSKKFWYNSKTLYMAYKGKFWIR